MISRLKLDDNIAILKFPEDELTNLLRNEESDDDDDDEDEREEKKSEKPRDEKFIEVEVNLALTALANAREIFQKKKVVAIKESKTIAANAKVLETVQEQTMKNLEKQKITHSIKSARKVPRFWFAVPVLLFFLRSLGSLV
jgi:DNA-binding XRE family transcriptional regulator